MSRVTFQARMDEMNRELLRMSSQVQQAISQTIDALVNRDVEAARRVIEGDKAVNDSHARVEAICIGLLLLQHPVASDARRITSVLKVITDLERMGDHAVNIAKAVVRMGGAPLIKPLVDIPAMGELAQGMVDSAVRAFVSGDRELAMAMTAQDHALDRLHSHVITELEGIMSRDGSTVAQGIQLLFVGHSLERIGDHATNLGEWLIYMLTGVREQLNQ